jgi:hypothetical protein
MAILKRLVSSLPVLRRNQVCPACGESFACELSVAKGCWCGEIKLSDAARAELRSKYNGCLCRACLEKTESENAKLEEPA